MANIEEIKKTATENGIELTDDVLEAIAGGIYTLEEWTAMNDAQRDAARANSIIMRDKGQYCKLLDD